MCVPPIYFGGIGGFGGFGAGFGLNIPLMIFAAALIPDIIICVSPFKSNYSFVFRDFLIDCLPEILMCYYRVSDTPRQCHYGNCY